MWDKYIQASKSYYVNENRPYSSVKSGASYLRYKLSNGQIVDSLNLIDWTRSQKNLLIVGPPGSGKTTTLDILASSLLEKAEAIPVFVSLRNLVLDAEQLIDRSLKRFDSNLSSQDFWNSLEESTPFYVLLYGWDEVNTLLIDIAEKLVTKLNNYNSCVTVVTSRSKTFPFNWPTAIIDELTRDQVDNILTTKGIESLKPLLGEEAGDILTRPLFLGSIVDTYSQGLSTTDLAREVPLYMAWRGHLKSALPIEVTPEMIELSLGVIALSMSLDSTREYSPTRINHILRNEGLEEAVLEGVLATDVVDERPNGDIWFRHQSFQIGHAATRLSNLVKTNSGSEEIIDLLNTPLGKDVIDEALEQLTREEILTLEEQIQAVDPKKTSILKSITQRHLVVESNDDELVKAVKNISDTEKRLDARRRDVVVFMVHGFNTRGEWKHDLVKQLAVATDGVRFIPIPWDYGSFKLRILWPFSVSKVVERFRKFYSSQLLEGRLDRTAERCVVAHSLGTHIVGEALQRFDDVRFDRMLLLRSVQSPNYPWNEVTEKVSKVRHEVGKKDWPLLLAKWWPWLGHAGRSGFNSRPSFVTEKVQRWSGHSDGIGVLPMIEEWIPFLRGDKDKKES